MNARLVFVHALSPLHAGIGQGVGVIDLPTAREKATGLPFLPGSSLKGTLRDSCTNSTEQRQVFGPDTANASDHAGSAQFSDQRLLLLPVRSLAGTFAWVTSPYVLRRFARDASDAGAKGLPTSVPQPASLETCFVHAQECAIKTPISTDQTCVVLEDLDLQPTTHDDVTAWATWLAEQVFPADATWQPVLRARFCIVHDDVLGFLLQTATEITARIKLMENTKTVEKGGLWYEEALPAETVLAGLVVATPVAKSGATAAGVFQALTGLMGKTMQFGGKATVGRGLCRVHMAPDGGQ